MDNLEANKLQSFDDQTSDELTVDDLEDVSGGLGPLAVAGIVAGGIIAVGVVKGAMDEEADERDRCRGRR